MKPDKKTIISIIFLLFVSFVLMGFYSILFRPQGEISEAEQRTLQKLPLFSIDKFSKGSFQTELDQAVSDQFLFSEEIKQLVKDWDNSLVSFTSSAFLPLVSSPAESLPLASQAAPLPDLTLDETAPQPAPVVAEEAVAEDGQGSVQEDNTPVAMTAILPEKTQVEASSPAPNSAQKEEAPAAQTSLPAQNGSYIYTEVVSKYLYKLDESGYIIQRASNPETYDFDLYSKEMLDKVTYPKYLYFINSCMSVDFRNPSRYDAFSVVKKNFDMDGYDQLKFKDFEEYKQYFYQTDHHWNYRGSYQGYKQCIRMLEGEDVEILVPTGTHVYPTIYNGSLARDNAIKCSTEQFTVYQFDIPPYKTYVDDEEAVYGYRYLYVSDDDFPHNVYSNHYGMYYGDDHAKVVYVFDKPEAQSLLILGTSYTNAVNELIASHYKETHVLDFRHYKKKYGEAIDAQSYMEEHNLDKLLIIGDISSLGHKVR